MKKRNKEKAPGDAWLHVVVTIELGLSCQEQADELHDKYGLSWEELEELENKTYEEKTRC